MSAASNLPVRHVMRDRRKQHLFHGIKASLNNAEMLSRERFFG
ncbi:hypothetical protein RMSM_05848 [Rhodopirellula maiorica SM1]|uniref:Uncharacterized protein n=1 Tax=Rhodopirellula maiorica SM1 TaxID=1265738 RepID=M5RCW1_9BACT|nr:hypothetical protein RMSM_05848 [Rhodopirellula maiorica SM1]